MALRARPFRDDAQKPSENTQSQLSGLFSDVLGAIRNPTKGKSKDDGERHLSEDDALETIVEDDSLDDSAVWNMLPEKLKQDQTFLVRILAAERPYFWECDEFPKNHPILFDKEMLLKAIRVKDAEGIANLIEEGNPVLEDQEFVMKAIDESNFETEEQKSDILQDVLDKSPCKNDPSFMMNAMKRNPRAYGHIGKDLQGNKVFLQQFVQKFPFSFTLLKGATDNDLQRARERAKEIYNDARHN